MGLCLTKSMACCSPDDTGSLQSPVTVTTAPLTDRLCEACERLDLSCTIDRPAGPTYQLGVEGKPDPRCHFCYLMTCAQTLFAPGMVLEQFQPSTTQWIPQRGWSTGIPDVYIVPLNEATATSPYASAREIQAQIDPTIVTKWLRLCDQYHSDTCSPTPGVIRSPEHPDGLEVLRVIDVHNKCVVEAKPGVRYVALSYVWGSTNWSKLLNENKEQLAAPQGILNVFGGLPLTMVDAIELVSRIGERYLWVDSLCLVQNDDGDLAAGVAKMDLVYRGAILTIVASDGDEANWGLAGVEKGSREVYQPIKEVVPGTKMTHTYPLGYAMTMTGNKYYLRGWTMQELTLSHRALIQAAGRFYFRCHAGCWCESTIFDNFPTIPTPQGDSATPSMPILPDHISDPLNTYVEIIYRYSNRGLSFESDSINAATGMLRHVMLQMKSDILEGLPTVIFDLGLLFAAPGQVELPVHTIYTPFQEYWRRNDFPSWSWAGWHGVVHSFTDARVDGELDVGKWLASTTYIIWYKRDPMTGELSLVWDYAEQALRGEPPGGAGYRCNPGPGVDRYGRNIDRISRGMNTMPNSLDPDVTGILFPRKHHVLHFWAYTVRFPRLKPPPEGVNILKFFKILGVDGSSCGLVQLDAWKMFKGEEGPYEAILLSKGDRYGRYLRGDPEVDERPFWWVMLLEWMGDGRSVAERRGIGYLWLESVSDVMEPGMVWKEIVLA